MKLNSANRALRTKIVGQVHGSAQSVQADQRVPIPVYTVLLNAGLSMTDVYEVGDEVWRKVKLALAAIAVSDDADEREKYTEGEARGSTPEQIARGRAYREEIHTQLFAQALKEMRFTQDEASIIERGMRLGTSSIEKPTGRRFARTTGPDGSVQEFEIMEQRGSTTVLKDTKTDQVYRV